MWTFGQWERSHRSVWLERMSRRTQHPLLRRSPLRRDVPCRKQYVIAHPTFDSIPPYTGSSALRSGKTTWVIVFFHFLESNFSSQPASIRSPGCLSSLPHKSYELLWSIFSQSFFEKSVQACLQLLQTASRVLEALQSSRYCHFCSPRIAHDVLWAFQGATARIHFAHDSSTSQGQYRHSI